MVNLNRNHRDWNEKQEPLGFKMKKKEEKVVVKKRLAKQERILKPKEEALPPPTAKDLGPSLTMLTLCNQISAETLVHPKLTPTLQAIKGALFEREYTRAFGSPEYLRAYVARWVPSRALAYRQMFGEEVEEVRALFEPKEGETKRRLRGVRVDKVVEEPKEEDEDEDESNEDDENEPEEPQPDPDSEDDEEPSKRDINIVCVGGGAGSEVLGFAAVTRESGTPARVCVQAVDSADWKQVLGEVTDVVAYRWRLNEDRFKVTSVQQDVLSNLPGSKQAVKAEKASDASNVPSTSNQAPVRAPKVAYGSADLITMLFTTAELLTASRPQTLAFLSSLTLQTKPGTLLLIVESAGSFSALAVGKEKTFPLEFLLDFVLAGGKGGDDGGWEIVRKEESRWYRLPEGVNKAYPLRLENMRHMLRLYRRRG